MRRLVIQLAPSARRGALALLAGVVLSLPTAELHAASLYLCKAYSGGTFWSAEPCQGRQALVDRIVNVPDGLPFKEQVRLGEQARVQVRVCVSPKRAATSRHRRRSARVRVTRINPTRSQPTVSRWLPR
jgi:hypothetical protein